MAGKSNRLALILLTCTTFIIMNGIGIIVPILPSYLNMFNVGGIVIGLLTSIFAFAQFIFSPLIGGLSDRKGRKQFILIGLVIYSCAQIIFGLADAVWMLFVARFFAGMGAAFVIPPVMAFVADVTTVEERGKGMGLIGASMSLGFMIGPAIGGFLAEFNLQIPLFVAGGTAFLVAILNAVFLPNVKSFVNVAAPKRENLFKQLALSVKKSYFVILIVVFTFSFGVANLQATFALYLDNKFAYSPSKISIILTVGGFIGVILQVFVIDKLFKRFGEMKVILLNLVVAALSMLLIIYIHGYFIMLTVCTLFSIATTFIRPAVNTLISKLAGPEQGYAAGMNNAYMSLGNMIGPALAGILYDWQMDLPYIFGAVILLSCCIFTLIWTKKNASYLLLPPNSK